MFRVVRDVMLVVCVCMLCGYVVLTMSLEDQLDQAHASSVLLDERLSRMEVALGLEEEEE